MRKKRAKKSDWFFKIELKAPKEIGPMFIDLKKSLNELGYAPSIEFQTPFVEIKKKS